MTIVQPKLFNTAGPCIKTEHYMLPANPRLPKVRHLIDREDYFVLYAPRQSGKTTYALEEVDRINDEGQYYAIYCPLEELSCISDEEEAMPK
ncbi:MAG: ATP-binding protein, partial [Deltaproteobacteria bacterium]|nr:ATP-binding protein [Deltaproteobacteria bacterium]